MKDNLIEYSETAQARNWSPPEIIPDPPQFRLNVLATTEKATVAALRSAARLAANLGAQITLISLEIVPWQFPLEKPPVAVALLEQKLYCLVYRAGIIGEEVRIQLCLCRDSHQGLQRILQPHSIVVLAESEHWWSRREHDLKDFLTALGHKVIFVEFGSSNASERGAALSRAAQVRSWSPTDLSSPGHLLSETEFSRGRGIAQDRLQRSDSRRGHR